MAPRAIPEDRLARLRAAFDELQRDADYHAAMTRLGENTEYLDGVAYESERRELGRQYGELAEAIAEL